MDPAIAPRAKSRRLPQTVVVDDRPAGTLSTWLLRSVSTTTTWALAALAVSFAGPWVELMSGAGAAVIFKVAAIAAAAGLLAIGPLRRSGCEPGPWTGLAWLALTIVVEMIAVSSLGPGWCELLGDPAVPWIRNVLMLSWLAAPTIFGRHEWWSPPRRSGQPPTAG